MVVLSCTAAVFSLCVVCAVCSAAVVAAPVAVFLVVVVGLVFVGLVGGGFCGDVGSSVRSRSMGGGPGGPPDSMAASASSTCNGANEWKVMCRSTSYHQSCII